MLCYLLLNSIVSGEKKKGQKAFSILWSSASW